MLDPDPTQIGTSLPEGAGFGQPLFATLSAHTAGQVGTEAVEFGIDLKQIHVWERCARARATSFWDRRGGERRRPRCPRFALLPATLSHTPAAHTSINLRHR